jgi:hypothetical protein
MTCNYRHHDKFILNFSDESPDFSTARGVYDGCGSGEWFDILYSYNFISEKAARGCEHYYTPDSYYENLSI